MHHYLTSLCVTSAISSVSKGLSSDVSGRGTPSKAEGQFNVNSPYTNIILNTYHTLQQDDGQAAIPLFPLKP